MKILYIEHDGDNLYMLKRRLERSGGFEVLAAEDSEQGRPQTGPLDDFFSTVVLMN